MSLAFEELYKPSGCLAFEVDLNYKQAIVNISRAERVTDFLLTDVNLGDCGEAVFKSCPETSSFCISKKQPCLFPMFKISLFCYLVAINLTHFLYFFKQQT